MNSVDRYKTTFLYVVMISGGIFQLTGIFAEVMTKISSLVMILLSSWLIYEFVHSYREKIGNKQEQNKTLKRFFVWIFLVFIISLLIENIGVQTGLIFGTYTYGNVLWPFIDHVPVAIGFAWINTLIPSMIIAKMLIPRITNKTIYIFSVITGILMVLLDIVLEPAAIKLNYWYWQGGHVPMQNYLAWFVLGSIFAFAGIKLKSFGEKYPQFLYHAYIAQILYMILVLFK